MSTQTEAALEALLFSRVKAAGGMAIKMMPVRKGIPDRLILWPGGASYLIELKTDVGEPSAFQRHWHSRAAGIGHPVAVLRGKGEILAWLRARAEAEDERRDRANPPRERQDCPECGKNVQVKKDGSLRPHKCEPTR